MLAWIARQLGVSTTVAGIVLALAVVQVATQVWALVDLARRDAVRGGRKWVWALVIVLANLPGAIAYLAAGRLASERSASGERSGAGAPGVDAARRAVDTLYGPRDRP
jgi:phospholipase D-like protein